MVKWLKYATAQETYTTKKRLRVNQHYVWHPNKRCSKRFYKTHTFKWPVGV